MCGIIGVDSSYRDVAPLIVKLLKKLEYRGYDSVGLATVFKGRIYVKKGKGTIDQVNARLKLDELPGKTGIGHTRWATHGIPSDRNAHPHIDCKGTLAVVHNGTIHNYEELREKLIDEGHIFRSETDTEVIVHLVEKYIREGYSPLKAVSLALKHLDGTYAIALISTYFNGIICAANGSPLVIGFGRGENYCCSDIPTLLTLTNRFIKLHDGDIAYLNSKEVVVYDSRGRVVERKIIDVKDLGVREVDLGEFKHYTLKEIYEQPRTLKDTLMHIIKQIEKKPKLVDRLVSASKILMVACGSSYHSSLVFAYLCGGHLRITCIPVVASEFDSLISSIVSKDDALIAVSQSGETADVLRVVRSLKGKCPIMALTNVMGSTLSLIADYVLYMNCGPEISVVATKTYTGQVISLLALGYRLALECGVYDRGEFKEAMTRLYKVPSLAEKTIKGSINICKKVSEYLYKKQSMLYLSRGVNYATAREGALKMKEMAYLHAEAYPAGEVKHGPLALVEKGYPTVFIIPKEEVYAKKTLLNAEEIKARGGLLIMVSPYEDVTPCDVLFKIPGAEELSDYELTVLNIIPLQLLAYYTTLKRKYNPDKPRNLAKSVTVE